MSPLYLLFVAAGGVALLLFLVIALRLHGEGHAPLVDGHGDHPRRLGFLVVLVLSFFL
jgi:hypothetical protein